MKKIFNRGFTLIELLVVVAIIGILIAVILSAFSHPAKASACWFGCGASSTSDTQAALDNQDTLKAAVPLPVLKDSLERANISKRLTTFQDPAKVSYIYLTSYGHVMAFYVVKGKVTSGGKRLTPGIGDTGCGYQNPCTQTELPELDGTYGTSGQYIFFWTTDGTYVQWNGEYMLADQPLQLTTQPELVRTVK